MATQRKEAQPPVNPEAEVPSNIKQPTKADENARDPRLVPGVAPWKSKDLPPSTGTRRVDH